MGTIVNIDPTADVCGVAFVDNSKIGRLYILSVFITNLLQMLTMSTPASCWWGFFYSKLNSLFSLWVIFQSIVIYRYAFDCFGLGLKLHQPACIYWDKKLTLLIILMLMMKMLYYNIDADDGALACLREMTTACASLPQLDKSQCAAPSNRNSLSLLYIIVTIFLPETWSLQEGGVGGWGGGYSPCGPNSWNNIWVSPLSPSALVLSLSSSYEQLVNKMNS